MKNIKETIKLTEGKSSSRERPFSTDLGVESLQRLKGFDDNRFSNLCEIWISKTTTTYDKTNVVTNKVIKK